MSEQMLHAAYHHKSFPLFLNKAYEIIRDWFWFERFELVPIAIEIFKSENPHVYSSVEKICLSMVIDNFNTTLSTDMLGKFEPEMEDKISKVLFANYETQPPPF